MPGTQLRTLQAGVGGPWQLPAAGSFSIGRKACCQLVLPEVGHLNACISRRFQGFAMAFATRFGAIRSPVLRLRERRALPAQRGALRSHWHAIDGLDPRPTGRP